jgi:hypothetical protein
LYRGRQEPSGKISDTQVASWSFSNAATNRSATWCQIFRLHGHDSDILLAGIAEQGFEIRREAYF